MELDPHPCKRVDAWPAPGHWHLVSYGLTELFEKVSAIPEQDGWGFELTMRVPRIGGESAPPVWAVQTLRDIVRYVENSGNSIGEGEHFAFSDGFIAGTNLIASVCTRDPSFPDPLSTPFGKFVFRQVVGITQDELGLYRKAGSRVLLEQLRAADANLITRPGRSSTVTREQEASIRFDSVELKLLRTSRALNGNTEIEFGVDDVFYLVRVLEQLADEGGEVNLSGLSGTGARIRLATTGPNHSDQRMHVQLGSPAARRAAQALAGGKTLHVIDETRVQLRVVDM